MGSRGMILKIMFVFGTPAVLLAALATRSDAFVMHSTGIRWTSPMSRTRPSSNMPVAATTSSVFSNGKHVSTTTMASMRARRERLAALGGVAKVDPGINTNNGRPLLLRSTTKGFVERTVAGSGSTNTGCGSNTLGWVGPAINRLAPQAALGGRGKGGGSSRGSLKTGLGRARLALGRVFGRGSPAAQVFSYLELPATISA